MEVREISPGHEVLVDPSNPPSIPMKKRSGVKILLTFIFVVGAFLVTSYAMFEQGMARGAIEACQTTGLTYYATINETNGNLTCTRLDNFLHNQALEEERIRQKRQQEIDEINNLNFSNIVGD